MTISVLLCVATIVTNYLGFDVTALAGLAGASLLTNGAWGGFYFWKAKNENRAKYAQRFLKQFADKYGGGCRCPCGGNRAERLSKGAFSMSKMTAKVFVDKAVDVAKNYKTLYVMGCFGAPSHRLQCEPLLQQPLLQQERHPHRHD